MMNVLKASYVWMLAILAVFLFQSSHLSADDALVGVIRSIKPSVVAIGTYSIKDTPKGRFYGTGFVVGNGKYVITNDHVLAKIEEEVKTFHLRVFHERFSFSGVKASILAQDSTHDLALLRLDDEELPPLPLADSSEVSEGESIAFTGYPIGFVLGLNPTTHTGIVSAISPIILPSPSTKAIKNKHFEFLRNPYNVFQIDAKAYPGNSGSPVYWRDRGMVIGVINKVFVKDKKENLLSEPTGITYAIPINHVKALLDKALGD
ncbi:MAG: serine protease [Desulfovermiculus sp.]